MKIIFQFWLMPKDILGGGFLDYDTNTYINAILQYLNLNSTKPPPKKSLDISQIINFR